MAGAAVAAVIGEPGRDGAIADAFQISLRRDAGAVAIAFMGGVDVDAGIVFGQIIVKDQIALVVMGPRQQP